jgi:hypothetical protein
MSTIDLPRFAWVSNNRTVKHRFFAKKFIEGELTLCGEPVQKGWSFWYGAKGDRWGDLIARECAHCSARAKQGDQKE